MCNLDLRYLDLQERRLSVVVKGGQWQAGVFSEWTGRYLAAWLDVRAGLRTCGYSFFVSIRGKTPGHQLTRGGMNKVVGEWADRAGLAALSPHDLLRSFASVSTKAGAPTRLLQVAGRWADIEMVERYTQDLDAEDFSPYFPVKFVMERP